MITPLGRSTGCMVSKYVGTDFDKVSNVSDNMNAVTDASDNINSINSVANNMGSVVTVSNQIEAVKMVSENIEAVVDVNGNKENINSLHEDMGTIKKVADALDTYQVMEQFTLSATQVDIVLSKISAYAAVVSVMGQLVDGESLSVDVDYAITSASTIRLARTYPAGTAVRIVQVVYKNEANPIVVIDGLGAFNRKIVTNKLNEALSPYDQEGRTVYPRLIVNGIPYVNVDEIEANTYITNATISNPIKGVITVTTNKGAKRYTSIGAEAVTRQDITKGVLTSSPDGSLWRLTVSDTGVVSAVKETN